MTETKLDKLVILAVSPRLAQVVKAALIVESEGPRSDDRSPEEIQMIADVIAEIDSQLERGA
jgi:hypothetical protein